MRQFPGYTLSSLMAEDAHALRTLRALLDPDLGRAREG